MGNDMFVAMNEASANGTTLFGLMHYSTSAQRHRLQRVHGQNYHLGEVVRTMALELPQVRQTFSVLGMQPSGEWGYSHGINEHRVAIGVTPWQSRLARENATPTGHDLVRLTLERSRSAHHAVEVLTDLIGRHGQGGSSNYQPLQDHIFTIVDHEEAYVLEACGRHWALLECRDTRVVTDACMIRQDWRKLAPGLADLVIDKGWWQDDGSKLDFVRCLGTDSAQVRAAQRRWGRASLALSEQHGAIDLHYLRRMIAEHDEKNVDLLSAGSESTDPGTLLANSFLVDLPKNESPFLVWVAFGIPRVSLYFPVCLAGELPPAWNAKHPEFPTLQDRTRELEKLTLGQPKDHDRLAQALEQLQSRFDQDAEEFLAKTRDGMSEKNPVLLVQLATEMMHHHAETFERESRRLLMIEEKAAPAERVEEELYFA